MLLEQHLLVKPAGRRGLKLPSCLSTLATAAVMLPYTSLLFFGPVEDDTGVAQELTAAVAANIGSLVAACAPAASALPGVLMPNQ